MVVVNSSEDCPRLSTLLLRDPRLPLQASFCDFLMTDSDKNAFASFLDVVPNTGGDVLALAALKCCNL